MEEEALPLRSVEPALVRFSEDAVPHHLQLLHRHHNRIQQLSAKGEWERVRAEQTNARRVANQLRNLLDELAALRRRVRPADHAAFDAHTKLARDGTLRALRYCLETDSEPPAEVEKETTRVATEEVEYASEQSMQERKCSMAEQAAELSARESALAGWRGLQAEVALVAEAWRTLAVAARTQREPVAATTKAVEQTDENVGAARAALRCAARWSNAGVCVVGAAAGALVAGPVGLVVGAKAAAGAALAGSLLGYGGASMLARRRTEHRD